LPVKFGCAVAESSVPGLIFPHLFCYSFSMMSGEVRKSKSEIVISRELYSELTRICLDALPDKAYGLIGGSDKYHPTTLYPCSTNLRNAPEWKEIFDSFGEFHRNPDVGFVIAPSEVKTVRDAMSARRESLVGVFHSHRFYSVEPTRADISLSSDPDLLCYIISVSDPPAAKVGIYSLNGDGYQSIPIVVC
jgi:proteasome lid subunit RPN8/RPN11